MLAALDRGLGLSLWINPSLTSVEQLEAAH